MRVATRYSIKDKHGNTTYRRETWRDHGEVGTIRTGEEWIFHIDFKLDGVKVGKNDTIEFEIKMDNR